MIVRHVDEFSAYDRSTKLPHSHWSMSWEGHKSSMEQAIWNVHAPPRPSSWQSGLPSFQEFLSRIEIKMLPNAELNQNAFVASNSTIPSAHASQNGYNGVAVTAFDPVVRHTFQPLVNYSNVQSPNPDYTNRSSHTTLSAAETYNSSPQTLSRLKSPNFAAQHTNLDRVPPSSSSTVPSLLERKIWHEAAQIFPLNEKIAFTKSGKPRKRLERACNACREKKVSDLSSISDKINLDTMSQVKCQLRLPKCIHCQKHGYECDSNLMSVAMLILRVFRNY